MVSERQTHFEDVLARLPDRLTQLLNAPRGTRSDLGIQIPDTPGIYLFSEHDEPVYVGQTRRLRSRLRQHTIPSSHQESATFAFLLAKKAADEQKLPLVGSRRAIATDPAFIHLFLEAKARVAQMTIQFVEMPDPIERTIFEIYAALHLGTERYNSFETH